jgi:hypothetical protein
MAIIMSHPMTSQEMRVLQEFRRLGVETLSVAAIKALKHPVGGGETPAISLTSKGYLTPDPGAGSYTLTGKAKDFLALDVKPTVEGVGGDEEPSE